MNHQRPINQRETDSGTELARQAHNLEVALRFARAGVPVHQSRDKRSIYPMYQRLDSEISDADRAGAIENFRARNDGRLPLHVGCTADKNIIQALFEKNPHLEWSISTGPAGWFVIDADCSRGGDINVMELFERHGGLSADCVVVNSQSGGKHIIFANDRVLGGRAGKLGALGCDIRANGGQIVCPGTWMSSGRRYEVDPNFASFENVFEGGKGLPATPEFIADMIGKATVDSALSDSSPMVRELFEQLAHSGMPAFEEAFDPTIGHDLADVTCSRPAFRELYENPSEDRSRNRFRMAQHLVLSLKGLTVLDYACFCHNWDGAGTFSDSAGKGLFTKRDLAREFARAVEVLKKNGMPSDGSAFGAAVDDDDDEPVPRVPLHINMNDPGAMVERVEDLLIRRNAQVYRRAASLVEVVTDKPLPGLNPKLPSAQLLPVNVERMSQLTGRVIDFRKYNARAAAHVSCPPPRDLMAHLMARGLRSKLPRISLLSTTPLIRPNGTLLCKPGYDPATEVLRKRTAANPARAASPTNAVGCLRAKDCAERTRSLKSPVRIESATPSTCEAARRMYLPAMGNSWSNSRPARRIASARPPT